MGGNLVQVIQTGAFTKASADAINGNFGLLAGAGLGPGKSWFVNANGGSNAKDGNNWANALHTMAEAFARLSSNDSIFFVGQVKEQLVAPLGVSNVRIYGAGTRPRYGNEGSFHNPLLDAASAWRPPAAPAAATPLLRLRQQGWLLANFLMDCPADAAGVLLQRAEDAVNPDPSSPSFLGMQFGDGSIGIEDVGGCYNVIVDNCRFQALTHGYKVTSTGIAVPLMNTIQNSRFYGCTNGIVGSFEKALIQGNIFNVITTAKINTISVAAQGGHNFVLNNYAPDIAADIDPAHGYTGSASDVWRTYAIDQADPVITSPPV